ncbi:MAG TPA: hypothetical protein VN132_02755 [Bdellovibrio sp.]|nr:hypothetical protein [Bdellovibrio sp.]
MLKGGASVSVIASNVSIGSSGNGYYNWSVPTTLATGSDYQISVTTNLGYSSTSGNFSIVPLPPPTAPTNLAAKIQTTVGKGKKGVTTTSVVVSFQASSSPAGIGSYKIYRNGVSVGSTTSTSYSDSGTVAGGGTYTYTVQPVDKTGQALVLSSCPSVSLSR